ncbi:hypothetical protein [Streptomyces sp. ISL-12]|nr:hypothetical protein [Streptomyces sp. ISL-12]
MLAGPWGRRLGAGVFNAEDMEGWAVGEGDVARGLHRGFVQITAL